MIMEYQNYNQNIDLKNINEVLNKIVKMISKHSEYVSNKLKSNSTDVNYHEIDSQQQIKHLKTKINDFIELNSLLDSISSSLNKNELFYDEYFDFCEIRDMINDTLNRSYSSIKESDFKFLLELVDNFSNLIAYKVDLMENNEFDEKRFESIYKSYLTKFIETKTYFYENICDETLDDDLFMEYMSIVMS